MIAIVALICVALVSASSGSEIPRTNETPHTNEIPRADNVARFQWFQSYIQSEMMKSENFREVFEPIMDQHSFFAAPCSYMMESYLRSGYEYINERYSGTLAAQHFAKLAGEKVRRCAEHFVHYSEHMPIMMLEWSFDELFKRVAHLDKKAAHQELAQAAEKLQPKTEAYDYNEVCKVAAAINKLRRDEASPLTQEIVKGETEVRGSSLVMWGEKVDKNMEAVKEVDCKLELAQFFEDTCKADRVSNHDGLRYVALAVELGMEPKVSERARKYNEYNRVCFDAKSNPIKASS